MSERQVQHGDVWRDRNGHVTLVLSRDTNSRRYEAMMALARKLYEAIQWRVCETYELDVQLARLEKGQELCEFLGSVTANEYVVDWAVRGPFVCHYEGSGAAVTVTMTLVIGHIP